MIIMKRINQLWNILEKKYPKHPGYFVCSKCEEKREKIIRRELWESICDLSFYDYPKTITKYKKQVEKK